jgi:uridine phosphorylase
MSYPILDYDSTREAFIEPSKVIMNRGLPEHCVLCFFKEVLEKVITGHNATLLVENSWEDGPHPVYEIQHQGQRLAFYHPGIGAPFAAALLEEVIAFGARKLIVCGGCGVLKRDIAAGNLIVVSGAVRDEGASYHYLPPAREVTANETAFRAMTETLSKRGIPYCTGKTWTTDAPYRETLYRIAKRKEEGCLTVDMECAALMAVAQFRNAILGQVMYGGDDLSGTEWDYREWQTLSAVRECLFWLCADACLAIP